MAAGTYHAGFLGTVTSGGQELSTIQWSVNHAVSVQEFMNSKSRSVSLLEATWNKFSVSITAEWDFAAAPFGLSLYAGQTITNVILYMHGTADTANAYTFPKLLVESSPVQVSVNGKIGYQFSGRPIGGPVTIPGAIQIS